MLIPVLYLAFQRILALAKPQQHVLQRANFEFFILSAMGVNSVLGLDARADYFVVVNGDICTPCKAFDTLLSYVPLYYARVLEVPVS